MGRKRTIDRSATMTAIDTVILRDGVGGLSIDAVAREAGISKSSVVYDFRNKAGLLAAFTRKRMGAHNEQIEAMRQSMPGPDQFMQAMIKLSRPSLSDEDTAVVMMLTAATHTTEECHSVMRDYICQFLQDAQDDAYDPRRTRLAFLALHGLKCLELFRFHRFDDTIRDQMLDDILALLAHIDPENAETA